jgi:hypothetical protein
MGRICSTRRESETDSGVKKEKILSDKRRKKERNNLYRRKRRRKLEKSAGKLS